MPAPEAVAPSGVAPPSLVDALATEAARLDRLAAATGDARYRIAAGILRGRKAGRPRLWGDDVLDTMGDLIDRGESEHEAARRVVETFEPAMATNRTIDKVRAAYRRRRKLNNN